MNRTSLAAIVAAAIAASACADAAAEPTAGEPPSTAAATDPATSVPATAPATTSPTTPPTSEQASGSTAPPTTVPESTTGTFTAPPTSETCGSQCPLTVEQQSTLDEFFAAYDGGDWDAFLATLATDEPSWQFTPSQVQSAELMRYDLIWSHAMNQTTTPTKCVDQYGTIRCTLEIEDDLHRALAPFGFEPSTCTMSLAIEPDGVVPGDFSGFDCFSFYDGAMHIYGEWFAEHYPDEPRISGFHYRGWNQTDETAGARAAARLEEWIDTAVRPFVESGGDIFDVRPGGH